MFQYLNKMFSPLFNLILILSIVNLIKCDNQKPLIKTNNGCLYKGSIDQNNGITVLNWKGIKYGQPPIGNLRFKPPQPFICTTNQVIDASISSNLCPQIINNQMLNKINMSEDCLQLSIWVPLLSEDQSVKSLPYRTLIILPGGNFDNNLLIDKDFDDGSILASRGGIIVITLQHRLGVLGFTYTDNPETPGNLGLLDQSLALQWIKSNIIFFGGDPSLLTIYGQGSGSLSSVIVNILNQPLDSLPNLNRFILSSNFPVPGSCEDKSTAFQKFVWLTEQVGCRTASSYSIETGSMLSCLRSLPLEKILEGQKLLNQRFDLLSTGLNQIMTKPTTGTNHFSKCVYDLNDQPISYSGLNILMLNMEDEGSTYLSSSESVKNSIPIPKGDDILNYIRFIDNQTILFLGQPIELLETIIPLYYAELLDGYEMGLKESLIKLVGDRLVYCPSLLSGLSLASLGSIVHHGIITYSSSPNYFQENTNKYDIFDSTYGARTGLDYWLIMGKPFLNPESNDQDRWMSNELIRLISDYVKTEEIPWPPLLPLSNGEVIPFEYDLDIKNPYNPLRKSDKHFNCKSWKPFIWPGNISK